LGIPFCYYYFLDGILPGPGFEPWSVVIDVLDWRLSALGHGTQTQIKEQFQFKLSGWQINVSNGSRNNIGAEFIVIIPKSWRLAATFLHHKRIWTP